MPPELETLTEPTPLGEKLFRSLLARIQSGELPPDSVVNEAALAQEFGVSRGPVREAVRRLQGIGLVSREPYLRARIVSLDKGEVLELFQMREALEGFAARLAAERMRPEELAALEAGLEADRQAWMAKGAPTGFDFHGQILEAARNRRLKAMLGGDLYLLLRLYRQRSGSDRVRKQAAYREHWQILRALKARDPELAESLMRAHVASASAHLAEDGELQEASAD
ncbi:MAG TPA: GntR family transcriptional regulator [Roseomonas sp.]|nr:GntR family transcriptional regulator [Roseomonas sp.]